MNFMILYCFTSEFYIALARNDILRFTNNHFGFADAIDQLGGIGIFLFLFAKVSAEYKNWNIFSKY